MESFEAKYLKIMALFEGAVPYPSDDGSECFEFHNEYKVSINDLKYHTNYNWLMKVWHGFNAIKLEDGPDNDLYQSAKHTLRYILTEKKIYEAFLSLGKAIEWYNKVKSKETSHEG